MNDLLLVRYIYCSLGKFNPVPDNKILTFIKLKTLADDNFIVTQTVQFHFDKVANIMKNGENAGYQHFLLLPQCF